MKTGYKRVYIKHNAYFFVDLKHKWHRLCALEDGEGKMLRELAKRKDAPLARPQSVEALVIAWRAKKLGSYATSTADDYSMMLTKIQQGFRELDAVDVTPKDCQDFLDQWSDAPRQLNKYRHLLRMLFRYACAPLGWRDTNPVEQTEGLPTVPRDNYITDQRLHAIRHGALVGKDGRLNTSGKIIVCAIDLAYLTFQRQKEIRGLRWADMDDEWIYFQPTKTKGSTGARVRWRRTPEINTVLERARAFGKIKSVYVIHTLRGKPYKKSGLYTAWRRACERADIAASVTESDDHFHDVRAKAMTDAKEAGYTIEEIQAGATHSNSEMTRRYIRRRQAVSSAVEMTMPKEES